MPVIYAGDLGPCFVYFDNVLVGPTQGGVKLKIEAKIAEVKEDGQGVAAVDGVYTGIEFADIEVPLTRFTLTQLEAMTEGAVLAPATKLTIPNVVGVAMYTNAKELQFRPAINNVASVDAETYTTILKATPYMKWEIGFDNSGQRIFKVAFKVFPCQTSPGLGDFMELGE